MSTDLWKNTPWHIWNSKAFAYNHIAWIPGLRSFRAFFNELDHKNPTPPPKLNQTSGKLWNFKERFFTPNIKRSSALAFLQYLGSCPITYFLKWHYHHKGYDCVWDLPAGVHMVDRFTTNNLPQYYYGVSKSTWNCILKEPTRTVCQCWQRPSYKLTESCLHKVSHISAVLKDPGLFIGHWQTSTAISYGKNAWKTAKECPLSRPLSPINHWKSLRWRWWSSLISSNILS